MKVINTQRTRLELLETLPKSAVCAELGVFRGDFSEEIVNRTQPATLYLVDIFNGVMRSGDRNGENVFTIDMRAEMDKVWKRFHNHPEVSVVQACSWDWLMGLRPGVLNWVYIDTTHHYEDTCRELAGAWQAVAPNGFICGHDYSPEFPGVVRAVNEFVQLHGMDLELFGGDRLPSFKLLRAQVAGRD